MCPCKLFVAYIGLLAHTSWIILLRNHSLMCKEQSPVPSPELVRFVMSGELTIKKKIIRQKKKKKKKKKFTSHSYSFPVAQYTNMQIEPHRDIYIGTVNFWYVLENKYYLSLHLSRLLLFFCKTATVVVQRNRFLYCKEMPHFLNDM